MQYLEVTLTRSTEDELKEALQEKLDDQWEVSLDITPMYKSGGSKTYTKGSYTITKYMCRVRKEESLVRAGRRIAN